MSPFPMPALPGNPNRRTDVPAVVPAGMRRLAVLVLAVATAAAPACAQEAITITETQWGFDGKAVEQTFTPLSVLVQNNTASPIEGTLRLEKAIQLKNRVDAYYEQDFYVSGFSSRWVQLTPYVVSDFESWSLKWGTGPQQRIDIPTPRNGDPAVVQIYNPDELQKPGGVLRRFNEALFPVSVTATDGLQAMALDRVPSWQGARVQAFLEWLERGGRVILLHDEDGQFPRFPSSLDVLNRDADRFYVGSGVVRRLELPADELSFAAAQNLIEDKDPEQTPPSSSRQTNAFGLGNTFGWDRDRQLFIDLELAARFQRNWWLVYGLVLLYLLAMYPGCYLVGRIAADWRRFYVAFLGTAALFSLGFASIGQLGSGDLNRVRTVAIARQLDEGLFDVTQWSSLAAAMGDRYEIRHGGSGRLYSTCQQFEAVSGTISTRNGGEFDVDMPPVSTRTLLHRTRLDGPELGIAVQQLIVGEFEVEALSLRGGDGFPDDVELAYACYRNEVYELEESGSQFLLKGPGSPTVRFLNRSEDVAIGVPMMAWSGAGTTLSDEEDFDKDILFRRMARVLIGNSFGVVDEMSQDGLALSEHLVRVFFYAPLPPEFRVEGTAFSDQRGYVLYVVDLPVAPES